MIDLQQKDFRTGNSIGKKATGTILYGSTSAASLQPGTICWFWSRGYFCSHKTVGEVNKNNSSSLQKIDKKLVTAPKGSYFLLAPFLSERRFFYDEDR